MRVEKDYAELLRLFNNNKVRYCIVGAFAFSFHAKPRYTKDMDILVERGAENARKIIKSLGEFGFGSLNLSEKDFCREGNIIQLGYEPVRVDLITSIRGLSFKAIWNGKAVGIYGGEKVFFIGLDELIKSKKIAKRRQDLIDLDILLLARKKRR